MGGHRNVDVTVERVAEKSAALLFNSHDPHGQPADFQRLSDSISVGKKLVLDISTEHHDERRALDFVSRDETSNFDDFVFDIDHVCSGAEDERSGKLDTILF